jgi:hypothetical protein
MRKHSLIQKGLAVLAVGLMSIVGVMGGRPGVGELYYEGQVVRTLVPPATMSKAGVDNLYPVMGGVNGQLPVAAVAPGDTDYHGGKWAVHVVTWNVPPYLLTSESEVLAAASAGDVTITRMPGADFKCPIQP